MYTHAHADAHVRVRDPRPQPHVQAGFPTALAALASLEAFNMAR